MSECSFYSHNYHPDLLEMVCIGRGINGDLGQCDTSDKCVQLQSKNSSAMLPACNDQYSGVMNVTNMITY